MTKLPDLKAKLMKNPEFKAEYEALDAPPLLTKCCSKCGEWKPYAEFVKSKKAKNGRRGYCYPCRRRSDAERLLDPEKQVRLRVQHNKNQKALREKNPEKTARYTRISAIRKALAVATCRRLGIDLIKLAKEQYERELASCPSSRS